MVSCQVMGVSQEITTAFKFLLAVTCDGLYVMDGKSRIIETIVLGTSNNATLLQADDEDSFLEGISIIKKVLLKGLNPLLEFHH